MIGFHRRRCIANNSGSETNRSPGREPAGQHRKFSSGIYTRMRADKTRCPDRCILINLKFKELTQMKKMFRTLALLMAALLAVYVIGCGGGDDEEETEAAPAAFQSANPPGGEVAANGTISVTFDNAPSGVSVTAGTVTVAGKTATITGPFTPGPLALTINWDDGSHTLNYTVTAPDTTAPTVTGGTVSDGDKDVDPEAINTDAKIEVTFSEDVTGSIALQTEGGDDVGWLGKVEGTTGTLELVKGKEIGNETTYVIAGKVSDAAGNALDVSITFVTKGKE